MPQTRCCHFCPTPIRLIAARTSVQKQDDPRLQDLIHWLTADAALEVDRVEPASSDASFRRYFRVFSGQQTRIAMDAPPARENSEPFVRVAAWLDDIGLHAPRVLAADLEQGFLLLTDLGSEQYLATLRRDPRLADELYGDAIAALVTLQQEGDKYQSRLPPYDATLLRNELVLFHDWLCGRHLGITFNDSDEASWRACEAWLINNALRQQRVLVHRDYHSRNLMVCDGANPGILDFQDAVEGPLTYDLVSLLKDCYIAWPAEQVRRYALDFLGRRRGRLQVSLTEPQFLRDFELMGVQRHLKAAGIFARLNHRDGKPGFMADVPRTLNYIRDVAPRYPELEFLHDLITTRVLPNLEPGQ